MLSKNFDSHGSHNRDSAYTEKTQFVGFFFCYLSVSFPNRDIIKLIWKHFVSPKKSSTGSWCAVHFHLSSSTCLFKQVFPLSWCSLQSYSVHIPIPLVPAHWKITVIDLCLLTECTNTALTPTPLLPLSFFPSLLRHNLQNAHKKFSFKLVISSFSLFSIFPSILLGKARKHFFPVLKQYLLH